MNKIKLINEIETRVLFMVEDCRTFYSAKICPNDCCKGGGNFLSILGSFSLINLLAKVNYVINNGSLWTEQDLSELKKSTEGIPRNVKNFIILPKVGHLKRTEENCFVELYKETLGLVPWGFSNEDEAKLVWSSYRNKLAHVASPSLAAAALPSETIKGASFNLLIGAIHDTDSSIFGTNSKGRPNEKCISAEKLNEHLIDIWNHIKKKFGDCDQELIEKLEHVIY